MTRFGIMLGFDNKCIIIDDVIQNEVTTVKYIEVKAGIMTRSWISELIVTSCNPSVI